MSGLGPDLATSQLLDCQGRVTHTFTVLPAGTVEIRTAAYTCTVDPTSRTVTPSGIHPPDEVLGHAIALARDLGGPW